jgi:uncharacterized protein (TIGR03435 family)
MMKISAPHIAFVSDFRDVFARILILLTLLPTAYGEGSTFEVASIKAANPTQPGQGGMMFMGCRGGPGTNDPVRWNCENITIPNLVGSAFDLKPFQIQGLSDELSPRMGGRMGQLFNIAAKVAEGATKEQFRQMQQNLLIERFGLKFHFEKKEIQGYELLIVKSGPKFKESEPESPKAPASEEASVPVSLPKLVMGIDGFPIMPPDRTGIIMTKDRARGHWIRTTMETIAEFLQGQTRKPVIDATGLKSKYDLSIEWAPDPMGNAAPIALGTASGTLPAASEFSGPSIFTALQEQLGLKLQPKKVPIDILMIDHIEEMPTEN